jgi:hypothetical protein
LTISTEQWKPTDANQYYNQLLEHYLASYYNYLNQQNFVLNHQKINYSNNIVNTSPVYPSITNTTIPIDQLKIKDRLLNEKPITVKPTFLKKNKVQHYTPIVKRTRPEFKSIFHKANSKI